ncbi:hypothetical protein H5410_015746 [Solanum commersonii]|uniref:Uncharacterized protein n=1 Tax=Solanum commersonii TaxID=4109 RepID=A0A9J5ZVB1_SOLCO|nr:hypothetical protein H5410_015746 [Solanum commersonii]
MELNMSELKTGRGLNQELGLVKIGDTHWGYHYKSFGKFISTLEERASASGFLISCQTFETIFLLHLMTDVLGITRKCHDSCKGSKEKVASFKR